MNRGFTIGEDDWDLLDAMGHTFGEDMDCMKCDIYFWDHQKKGKECPGREPGAKMGRPAATMQGYRNSQSKLQEAQVFEIRRRKEKGETNGDLAEEFGVSRTTICDIHRGKRWAHLLTRVDN